MTEIDLARVCELVSQGKGDVTIAETFAVTRHAARKLIEQAKVELARQEQRGEIQSAEVIAVDPEPETIPEFVAAINKCLRKSVEGYLEAGRHLANAKIKHRGEFMRMVERDLGITIRTADRMMAIARDERIWTHVSTLPTKWGTVYELIGVTPERFEEAIESGEIHPGMSRQDAIRLKNPAVVVAPEGEGPFAADEGSSDAAVPSRQESGDRNQESESPSEAFLRERHEEWSRRDERLYGSESEVMPSETKAVNVDTPPRPAQSEPGGAEEKKPESKPAWNASRITPPDALDFYPTGPWITRTLFEQVLPQVGIRRAECARMAVWEPACGEGHMAEVIQEYVLAVYASDIHGYGYSLDVRDFLGHDVAPYAPDWIITNPPYNGRALDFALRALDLAGEGVALFTSAQWVAEGKERYERLFRDRPPTLIAFFVERAPVHENRWLPKGDTKQAYCWVVWRKNHRPKAPFWIPPGCRESLTKPDDAERFTAHPVKRKEFLPMDAGPDQPAASPVRSGEMGDIPGFLRRKEQTEQAE